MHHFPRVVRMRDGTGTSWERHHDSVGPSSDGPLQNLELHPFGVAAIDDEACSGGVGRSRTGQEDHRARDLLSAAPATEREDGLGGVVKVGNGRLDGLPVSAGEAVLRCYLNDSRGGGAMGRLAGKAVIVR